jgi:UDP-N-acetyl-2-amino-2-deoxyglucuronate dehydrogenase
MSMMKKIKFSLVGCGKIGQRHAEYIAEKGLLKAVCDIKPERAGQVAKKFGAKVYSSVDELYSKEKDTDVISICSPNGLHAEQTVKALRAGFHVLCEKPMATSVVDCEKMINESLRANKRLFVVKQNRFNPPVEAIKKCIDEGTFGKIYSVQLNCFWNRNSNYYKDSDWKGTKTLDGGTLYTQFSHFIDLLFWMFGDIKEAKGFSANFNHQDIIEFEDTGVVSVRFYNGILGNIHYTVNSYQKNMEGSMTIFGEKGTAKIGGKYLNELEYQLFEGYKIDKLPEGRPPNMYGDYVGSMSNHDKVYDNIIDVLTNRGIIATNGYEGLKTVEIIDKIYSSILNS